MTDIKIIEEMAKLVCIVGLMVGCQTGSPVPVEPTEDCVLAVPDVVMVYEDPLPGLEWLYSRHPYKTEVSVYE